jgi:tRNA threonylcarbamoyl adenosine modification protein (Sua5/YciO/YrdC/YwlC family)
VVPAGQGSEPPAGAIGQAAQVLAQGWPVGIPTDTVYGLAVDPFRTAATERLFEAKRRPREVNLPVLVADVDQALSLAASVPEFGMVLMHWFWPGPLTIVLPKRAQLAADLGDDDLTVGVRCPGHAVPRALALAAGPLATTSANLHGEPTLVTAAEVAAMFAGRVPLVLDGGTCRGLASTVVDCTGEEPKLLRQGRLPWEDVLAAVDR